MRHTMLLVAVIVLCALGPPSWAYYNPFEGWGGWNVSMHLSNYDVGTQYFNLADGTYTKSFLDGLDVLTAYNPNYDPDNDGTIDPYKILPVGAQAGEDNWGIFKLDQIFATTPNYNEVEEIWTSGTDGWEITAIFWGEEDQGLIQASVFGQSVQKIWGDGLYASFFANQPGAGLDFNTVWTNGPTPNTNGPGNSSTVRPGGAPEYIGVTDSPGAGFTKASGATPLWTFRTVYGTDLTGEDPNNPGTYLKPGWDKAEYVNTFYPASPATAGKINGSGSAYAVTAEDPYWGTGVGNWQWQSNPFQDAVNPHDVELAFTAEGKADGSAPGNGWLVSSSDPLKGAVTPELSSASLMLIGLFPLGLVAWKRRKQ